VLEECKALGELDVSRKDAEAQRGDAEKANIGILNLKLLL